MAAPELTLPTGTELSAFESDFNEVIAATVAADGEHDKELTRAHYTDDVVIIDASASDPGAVGIEEYLQVAGNVWALAPSEVTTLGETYIGVADGVAVLPQHGLLEYTEESPLIEYRIHGIRDELVAYWTAFYDPATRPFFTEVPEIEEAARALRVEYVEAWSSGDPAEVGAMFAADATFSDPLAGGVLAGSAAIASHAAALMAANVNWELVAPIGSRDIEVVRSGGVLAMGVPQADGSECSVEMVVILEGGESGIVDARAYYDVGSLIGCGLTS